MGNSTVDSALIRSHHEGFRNYTKFIAQLKQAIDDEASAAQFYTSLAAMTPDAVRDFVTHARDDELTHLKMFRRLYRKLTGRDVEARASKTEFTDWQAGVEVAFRRELEAFERYRDMYLGTRIPSVRDVLFKAMTDEMEHAQRFLFLRTRP